MTNNKEIIIRIIREQYCHLVVNRQPFCIEPALILMRMGNHLGPLGEGFCQREGSVLDLGFQLMSSCQ